MAVETQQVIQREAPEVEAYKLGLLESAKELADQRVTLPTQQVAGMSPLQLQALSMASPAFGGIGGYQQYLNQAGQTLSGATPYIEGAVGSAQPLLSGASGKAQPFITQGAAEGTGLVRRERGDPFIHVLLLKVPWVEPIRLYLEPWAKVQQVSEEVRVL
jgi:hypothetical protein